VSSALLYGYLVGWVLTSVLVAVLAWRLRDDGSPAAHPTLLSFLAGAAWPLVVAALAEAGVVALAAEVMRQRGPRLSVVR
jgi:cytochrome c biogenesis protein CcdA